MHFLELLEQVSDRDTAVYYAKNCGSIPKKNYAASRTLIDGNYSFEWCGTVQGHKFWAEIRTKLCNHTQDEEVTYAPEVYEMYKTQNFIEEVSSNIRDYSIIIKDTSIEDRRKLHSLLYCLDEPVYKNTRLHTDYTIEGDYFRWIGFDGVWKMVPSKRDDKQEITIQDFIAKFSKTKTTKMKHICELLEELFDKETAIKFANNAIKKPHLHSKVLTEKNAINSLLWENTPEGDVFWRVIHKQLSSTDKVSMCMDTFKEYASKDVQHALETKQNKTTKKETFMSKLKTTTLNTLEQNKQAAIIAAKVDAGRIINKQVIKQLKPHVPMLLRGYLDTPLAPVIAANVVAMIGNHTDNSKVKKVSELMLLGAADATVQSFNLDKIIDDVLAGIKLPAGFLDADDN